MAPAAPIIGMGIGAIGMGFQIAGQMEAADAQADAARRQAYLQEQQADEVLRRATINVKQAQYEATKILAKQQSAFSKAGVGGLSKLLFMEEAAARAKEDILNIQRDADYRAALLRSGAGALREGAGEIQGAMPIGVAGTLLTGTSKLLESSGMFAGSSGTPSIPRSAGYAP